MNPTVGCHWGSQFTDPLTRSNIDVAIAKKNLQMRPLRANIVTNAKKSPKNQHFPWL